MDYLDQFLRWASAHSRQLRLAVIALVVFFQLRAVLILAAALAVTYYLIPEVQPYWRESALYFVYGLRQLF